ncbi:MAG TPA: biotin/lipoyl-binding protein, partial [Candidatus Acidoferrum sp.]
MAEENSARSAPRAAAGSTVSSPPSVENTPPGRPYRAPKNRNKTVILVVVILIVLVGGFFLWRYFSTYESTDDAQVDVHLYPVSARISGYVIKVNVNDNQWVQQGTVLAEIDPKDFEVAVAQAQANLANAEATAQSLNITVPITSTNASSQLRSTASGIENS